MGTPEKSNFKRKHKKRSKLNINENCIKKDVTDIFALNGKEEFS